MKSALKVAVLVCGGLALVGSALPLVQLVTGVAEGGEAGVAGRLPNFAAHIHTAQQFPNIRRTVYSFDGSRDAFYEWLQRVAPEG